MTSLAVWQPEKRPILLPFRSGYKPFISVAGYTVHIHKVSVARCIHIYILGDLQGFPATEEPVLSRRPRFPEGASHVLVPTETRMGCSRPRLRTSQSRVSLGGVPGPRVSGTLRADESRQSVTLLVPLTTGLSILLFVFFITQQCLGKWGTGTTVDRSYLLNE